MPRDAGELPATSVMDVLATTLKSDDRLLIDHKKDSLTCSLKFCLGCVQKSSLGIPIKLLNLPELPPFHE